MTNTPDLAETLDHSWQLLEQGARDRLSPARLVVLSTVLPDGGPDSRMVALRRADRGLAELDMHTDLLSHKINQLRLEPRVSVHLWLPDQLVQLRLSGAVQILSGEVVAGHWPQVPQANREAYGHVPPPGTEISASGDWQVHPEAARFCVLRMAVVRIDAVSLDPAGHRRALFSVEDIWQGRWISP